MVKKRFKLHLFLLCIVLVSILGAKSIAYAEEKAVDRVTIQTGTYGEIVNVESGKRLNVKGNSSAQEAAVTLYQQDGTTGQRWQFLSFPNGYSLIPECAASTGRVLNIYGYSAKAGSRICLWSSTQSDTQCWTVEAFEDGSFILRSKSNPELCLAESGTGNGSAITLKAYSKTDKSIRWTSSLVSVTKNMTSDPEEKPKEIKLSATSINTYIHIPIQLTLENADASKVIWTCSNESRGTVYEDGVVRASKKNCTFYVYAKYEGKSYTCKITVEKNDPKFTTYKEKLYYAKKDDVPVYMGPHSSAPLVTKLNKYDTFDIVGELVNKAGNCWYLTGGEYYIYSGNCVSAPEYTDMEKTILFAQGKNTAVYALPDVKSPKVEELPMNTYLTMIGELTDKNGTKWYVTYGPDNAGALRYVLANEFKGSTYLTQVCGCTRHDGLCTFCAVTTMIRRRAVLDGFTSLEKSPGAVTFEMIHAKRSPQSGGLVYSQEYWVGDGTLLYKTEYLTEGGISNPNAVPDWGKTERNWNIHDVQTLIDLCALHPEGIVIYDSEYGNNNKIHAVCISDCIQWEDGTYSFYIYDIDDDGNLGTSVIRLEDSKLFRSHGYNMQALLDSIRWIVFIPNLP